MQKLNKQKILLINNIGRGYLPALLITKKIFSSIFSASHKFREAARRAIFSSAYSGYNNLYGTNY